MPFQLVREGVYPGTDLPFYRVYDADEYQDVTVKHPRAIGEVWGVGIVGVTGRFIPTGVRYSLTGSEVSSSVFGPGQYAVAARVMIARHELRYDTQTNAGLAGTVDPNFAGI